MNAMLLKLYLKSWDLLNREEGQDLVENALILALIVVGAVAVLTGLGSQVVATLSAINSAL
jgi:Flp pilus assembly pilin Flp